MGRDVVRRVGEERWLRVIMRVLGHSILELGTRGEAGKYSYGKAPGKIYRLGLSVR